MAFNGLSAAEVERLAHLAEEAGEVVQTVGKILRHGWYSRHPDGGQTNKADLEKELGDLMGVADLMVKAEDIYASSIDQARLLKSEKSREFYHHQPKRLLIKHDN